MCKLNAKSRAKFASVNAPLKNMFFYRKFTMKKIAQLFWQKAFYWSITKINVIRQLKVRMIAQPDCEASPEMDDVPPGAIWADW